MGLNIKFYDDKQKEGEIVSVGYLPVDTKARKDSRRLASSGAVAKVEEKVDNASDALQEQIDEIAEKAGSGYIPKGEADVATLNGLSGQENGDLYTMTDDGTLTDGSIAVVAGDTVAWDDANSVWYKAMNYAPAQYGTDQVKNLPTSITAFRTGDVIPVDGPSGTAKMSKDDLLAVTAQNALGSIHSLSDTATESDLVAGNYFVIDGSTGTMKLPAEDVAKRSVQDTIQGNFAEEFDPSRTEYTKYNVNELVLKDAKLYICIAPHYGVWDNSDFQPLDLNELMPEYAEGVTAVTDTDLEQGSYSFGDKTAASNRIRTKNPIRLLVGKTYTIRVGTGYQFSPQFLNYDLSYSGTFFVHASTRTFVAQYPYAVIAIKREDDADFTPSEASAVNLTTLFPKFEVERPIGEKVVDDKIYEIQPKHIDGYNILEIVTDLEQGAYSFGNKTAASNRIRTPNPILLDVGKDYRIGVDAGYQCSIQFLKADGSYSGDHLVHVQTHTFNAEWPKCVIIVKRDDDADFTPSETGAVNLTIEEAEYEVEEIVGEGTLATINMWYGRKANFLGDSITYGYGAGHDKNWTITCAKILGLKTARNYGINNSTVANYSDPMSTRYSSMSDDADLVVVLGGRNDYGYSIPIGVASDVTNATFYGAMNILAEGLRTKYPTKEIVFFTPFKALKLYDGIAYKDDHVNSVGATQEDYVNVIKEVCAKNSITVIDLYNGGQLTGWNTAMHDALFLDTIHPSEDGHKFLGKVIAARLSAI